MEPPGRHRVRRSDRSSQFRLTRSRKFPSVGPSHPASTVDGVPRISAFYGIIIAMYFDDHPPPHFHAKYGEYEAQVVIATGELLNGDLPLRARALVKEWTELHRSELMDDWARAERQEPMRTIEPLP